jgi:replicative superfamily II helicase
MSDEARVNERIIRDPRTGQPIKTIEVTVNSDEMRKLVEQTSEQEKEIKELKEQVQDSEEAKANFEQEKEILATELTALEIPTEVENLRTKEDVDRAKITVMKLREKAKNEPNPASGGVAPLSGQFGTSPNQGFDSIESLIDNLRDRSSHSNPNLADRKLAQEQLNKLMEKSLRGQKETLRPFNYSGRDVLQYRRDQFLRRKKMEKGES